MRSKLSLRRLDDRIVPALMNFNLTTATSSLALSGVVAGVTISQQGAGSLTTTYTGTVQLDFDPVAGTIAFLEAGTSAKANISGNWTPLVGGIVPGTEPANYGGRLVVLVTVANFAGRDAVATLNSAALALTGAGAAKTFPSTQDFHLTAGSIDYNQTFPTVAMGNASFDNTPVPNTAAAGTFTDSGNGTYALILPVSTTIVQDLGSGNTATINLKGTLNATAILPVVDLNGAGAGNNVTFTAAATLAGTAIAPSATITRTPAANLTGMVVTLTNHPDDALESLAVDLTGTSLSTSGYDPVTGILEITGSATLAIYQSVLQKVKYADSKPNATVSPRAITVTVSDAGNSSLPRTATGAVIPIAKISSVVINGGAAQRSMVRDLTVTFDSVVTFAGAAASAFAINGAAGVAIAADTSASTATQTIAKLTFSGAPILGGSLADGAYSLSVASSNGIGNGVIALDGDGNNLAGDNYTSASFSRKFGDSDGDGDVDITDFTAFRTAFGNGPSTIFDSEGDGDVDVADFTAFRMRFGT